MLRRALWLTALVAAALGIGSFTADLSAASAENWSRFRGPNGTGVSSATNLPVEFGPGSHVKWKAAIPTPVPADGELFVRTRSALYDFAK